MSDVVIRQTNPAGGGRVDFELVGDDDLSGGVGGWATLDRPRRTAAVTWTGTPAQTYTLPLLLDGMDLGPGLDFPIESQCNQLLAWGRGSVTNTPPVLQVTGLVIVPDTSRWVLQDLSWGGKERDRLGRRVQQYVTVTLLEYVTPVLLDSPAKKARHHQHQNGGKGGKGGKD